MRRIFKTITVENDPTSFESLVEDALRNEWTVISCTAFSLRSKEHQSGIYLVAFLQKDK